MTNQEELIEKNHETLITLKDLGLSKSFGTEHKAAVKNLRTFLKVHGLKVPVN